MIRWQASTRRNASGRSEGRGLKTSTEVMAGNLQNPIVEYAEARRADFVFISLQTVGSFSDFLLQRITQADCSVGMIRDSSVLQRSQNPQPLKRIAFAKTGEHYMIAEGINTISGLGQQPASILQQQEIDSNALITLEHIYKVYKMGDVEINALRGISLTITKGEFVAIMGASGSGKSTLMNIIGCMDRPTRGRYCLEGQDISKLSKDELADIRNHKIGFVFQGFNLLPRTSAMENVELPLLYLEVPEEERDRRTRKALELVGLGKRLENMPNQLSGGQQQRVAIARALVNEPSIILADEPTGNLDSRTAIEIMEVFQFLNRERGITIALVTHEPDIAQFVGRIVVFKDGRIQRDYKVEHPCSAKEMLAALPQEPVETDQDESAEEA